MKQNELFHLSALARLSVTEAEAHALSEDLDGLLSLCQSLRDLSESEQDALPENTPSLTRDDTPAPCLPREDALANAPAQKDGFICI
ncbi:MAG: aspartyl/glutamyl-tRNA amidotransferase subunit C [Clostridia bacterium]|nr:aspartyl/glutamyl-tRNA amidotransferase subunit C [Clostridia bacterium]